MSSHLWLSALLFLLQIYCCTLISKEVHSQTSSVIEIEEQDKETDSVRPFAELSEEHLKYIDKLFRCWERNMEDYVSYEADFTSWLYNSSAATAIDPDTKQLMAQHISVGEMKLTNSGLFSFSTNKVWNFDTSKEDRYSANPEWRSRFAFDGKTFREYRFNQKELVEHNVPKDAKLAVLPNMLMLWDLRPKLMVSATFPFVALDFDLVAIPDLRKYMTDSNAVALARWIKEDHWIRVTIPQERGEQGEYWLELYPKHKGLQGKYQMIEIVLEKSDFLPARITLFFPDHDLENKRIISKQIFRFKNRRIHRDSKSADHQQLLKEINHADKPFGWRRIQVGMGVD